MEFPRQFFITTAKGIEPLLADELRSLGGLEVREGKAGVSANGTLEFAYRICLWSRLASRVFMELATFPAGTPEELYQGVKGVDWSAHMNNEGTLAVSANVSASSINDSRFAALKVKDAVVDQFRQSSGTRPDVRRVRPDIMLNIHINRDRAVLSLDMSGEALHKRGYRGRSTGAPLKENLAAAILVRAGWPETWRHKGSFLDPMCGSGTLPIEAALMAFDIAPGLLRTWFGFLRWRGHRPDLWDRLLKEAEQRRDEGWRSGRSGPAIWGFDADKAAVLAASQGAERAGLAGKIAFEARDVRQLKPPDTATPPGLLVVNPPYGARMGRSEDLKGLYATLGERLKENFESWDMAVFTGNPELKPFLGLRSHKRYRLYNGAIECELLLYRIEPGRKAAAEVASSEGRAMIANRLRKNLRRIGRWAGKNGIGCYRLYDADLPEYAAAIDIYESRAHVQEYEAPPTVDAARARTRIRDLVAVVPEVLDIPPERVFLKVRSRKRGLSQYEKLGATGEFHEVGEGGLRFLVNFSDYLDTGLFLDHRMTRAMIRDLAQGKRFLNLFSYTGTASVYAAKGGARSTTSVDMSRTYLEWAGRNFSANKIKPGDRHRLVHADCLEWIDEEDGKYDLIFLDPPSFSNSKRMKSEFDVQRDHVDLIRRTLRLLARGGLLIFSTNRRKFRMKIKDLGGLNLEDITIQTIDKDFERNPRIHSCWKIKPAMN